MNLSNPRIPEEILFRSKQPRLNLPGTRRGRPAAETLTLIQPFLARAGVTRVGIVSGLDVLPIPVAMATRPLSCGLTVSQGKGLTEDCAKISATMEAIEHYHAETIQGTLRLASEAELPELERVEAQTLPMRRPEHTRHRRLLWQQGTRLLSERVCWIPFELIHLDLRNQGPVPTYSFAANSNGLASGNSAAEAAAHALYEVIERHLVADFHDLPAEEQDLRRLVNSSVTDHDASQLLRQLQALGVHVTVWDLSGSINISCFLCEILGGPDPTRIAPVARGYGCHSEAAVALCRAICEAAQSRVTIVSGSRDDMSPKEASERHLTSAQAQFGAWSRSQSLATRLFRAAPSRSFTTFGDELRWLCVHLTDNGFDEPVVVDISKPDWPISVVRVIAPGLRFDPTGVGTFAQKERLS